MNFYLLGGLVLGFLLVLLYVIRHRREAKLESETPLFLSGVAIPVGVRLIYVTATAHELKPFGTEERVYIVIGGLALIWVSVQTILTFVGPVKPDG